MKSLTPQQIGNTVEDIISEKEQLARLKRSDFIGISKDDLMLEIERKLGVDWVVKKEEPFRVNKQDMSAIANNRFFRKTGMRMLMLLAIVILGLATLTSTLRVISPFIYYGLEGIVAVGFLYFYAKKQRDFRIALCKQMEEAGLIWEA